MTTEIKTTKLGIVGRTVESIGNHGLLSLKFTDGSEACWYDKESDTGNDVEIWLEDVAGDLDDLRDAPLILAEECSGEVEESYSGRATTWTFVRLATTKGTVTLRFGGSSNGEYSEAPAFIVLDREEARIRWTLSESTKS